MVIFLSFVSWKERMMLDVIQEKLTREAFCSIMLISMGDLDWLT